MSMITTISWNCRGIGVGSTIRALRDVLSHSKPQVLFLAQTKGTGNEIRSLKRKIRFPNSFHIDATGRFGGLALFWSDDCVVKILMSSKIFILTKVFSQGSSVFWFLTCIYGCPTFAERRTLWDILSGLMPPNDSPWCCVGDFNEILLQEDKDGLRPHSQIQIDCFRDFLDRNLLMDMSLKVCRFTWYNNCSDGCVREKIDRILFNYSWITRFPHATGEALPAIGSDHSPIMVRCDFNGKKKEVELSCMSNFGMNTLIALKLCLQPGTPPLRLMLKLI